MRQGDGGDAHIHRAEAEFGPLERCGSFGGGIIIEFDKPDLAIVEDVLLQVGIRLHETAMCACAVYRGQSAAGLFFIGDHRCGNGLWRIKLGDSSAEPDVLGRVGQLDQTEDVSVQNDHFDEAFLPRRGLVRWDLRH